MRMMTFECGFKSVGVPYRWLARKRGFSHNTLARLFDQGLNGIITYTSAPMRLVLLGGFVISALAMLFALSNFITGLILYRQIAEPGIMTIVVAVFFFGGVQLFVVGLLGEYILAIYAQVRRKPVVFERERINFGKKD
jgi:hypothetical protein